MDPSLELQYTKALLANLQREAPKLCPATLGGTLYQLRKTKGLRQNVVASKGGISCGTLSRMELGENQNPTLSVLLGAAQGLQMPLSSLMTQWEENQKASSRS
jgi:transcriptional regulator with XRE-family HTH domain